MAATRWAFWQDLVDRHGLTGGYQTFKRFVRKLRGSVWPEARVIIETTARTRLFVLTLGWSRKCVRLLAFRSSARVWAELHEQAFAGLAVRRGSRSWITSAKAYCLRTSTILA